MSEAVEFECASMSEEGLFYRIAVAAGEVICSCGGIGLRWCSHIEATLIAGERAMVPEAHRAAADQAMGLGVALAPPAEWKAAWRRLLRWRGLTPSRIFHPSKVGESGRPVVCFTGAMPRPRKAIAFEAEEAGWEVIDSPHRMTAVLVAMETEGTSNKLRFARRHGIPIVSLEHWTALMTDGDLPAD